VPGLEGWPIYQAVIVLCLAASLPAVLHALRWRSLFSQPAHLCVIGLLPAILLSNLSHGDLWQARTDGLDFLKQLVFYFLMVGLLTTRRRLEIFLGMLFLFIATVALLSVLTYHGVLNIANLNPMMQNMASIDADEMTEVPRLLGTGIFSDPNDLSLILVTALMIGTHLFVDRKLWLRRLLLLPVMACLAYAFYLTRSRGGFLSLMAASGTYVLCRYPWRRSVLILVVAMPLAFVLFGGRQTDIDLGDENDTAQGRIHLWRDSLVEFHQSPIFGIGSNQLVELNDLVAHNSYVQSFAELGVVGGTLFVGVLCILFSDLGRLCRSVRPIESKNSYGWTGCVLAILAGYAVGLFSLTRVYETSTYAILGVAAAFAAVLAIEHPEVQLLRRGRLVRQIAIASIGCLFCLECCARFLAT
jgi:O-antigen ligase